MFDADYYERGILTKKSNFENYRWIPELTIPMAMTIIDYLRIRSMDNVLDYGCAKGFLVKALRWLNRNAWGYDISEYAIKNADPEVQKYVSNQIWDCDPFSFCIAKDVFEHIPEEMLARVIEGILKDTEIIFAVVPLGENGRYRAESNNLDVTHVICEPEEWWIRFFKRCHREVSVTFRIPGIKDSYRDIPMSHGFFTLV
jgi:hypothetical protein